MAWNSRKLSLLSFPSQYYKIQRQKGQIKLKQSPLTLSNFLFFRQRQCIFLQTIHRIQMGPFWQSIYRFQLLFDHGYFILCYTSLFGNLFNQLFAVGVVYLQLLVFLLQTLVLFICPFKIIYSRLFLQIFLQNLILDEQILFLDCRFITRQIFNQIAQYYLIFLEIFIILIDYDQFFVFPDQLPKDDLEKIVQLAYLVIHVSSKAIKLSGPLHLSCFSLSILGQILLQLLQLSFHILLKILKIRGHREMKNILEGVFYLLLYFLELFFIFQSVDIELILIFFIAVFGVFIRVKPVLPAQSSLFLFLFVFLRIFFAQLYLLFLQERKYISGRLYPKVKILKCISFDILVGKQLKYLFVKLSIFSPQTLLLFLLQLEMVIKQLRQLFFQRLIIESIALVQWYNIFDGQIVDYLLFELSIVKNILQLHMIDIYYFFLLGCVKIICQKFVFQFNLRLFRCQMFVGGYYTFYLCLQVRIFILQFHNITLHLFQL